MTQEEIKLMKPGDKFLFNGMHAEVTSNSCGILAYELDADWTFSELPFPVVLE